MTKHNKLKRKEYIKQNIPITLMALPAMLLLLAFYYLPMFGLVLSFKEYSFRQGVFGSPWVGLKNFAYIFNSGEIARTIGNTIGYHLGTTITVTLSGLLLSVLLYFIRSRRAANLFQKTVIIPYMVSYTVIAYIVYILLKNNGGLVNSMLQSFGAESLSWYTEPKYWPFIIILVQIWFGAGVKSVYYYAALMSIDESLFEAADLDGAKRHHKVFSIMLPSIAPTICIFLILDLGNILASNLALFYSVPMDSSALYPVTDVLATYTYRGLVTGDIGTTTALGLFTGVVTTVATLLVNAVVRKISPENALL